MRKFNPQWLQRSRKKDNPEGRLQLQIIHYLRDKGFYCAKLKTKGAFTEGQFLYDPYLAIGCADLIAFTPKLYFIEVKNGKKGVHSPQQQQFQSLCNNANVSYILARDLETVIEQVK